MQNGKWRKAALHGPPFPYSRLRFVKLRNVDDSWDCYSERIQILFLALKQQLPGGEIRGSRVATLILPVEL
jgi:hypothetical protein